MIETPKFIVDGSERPEDVGHLDWNAEAYERIVVANLERIEATGTGRALFRHLPAPVVIVPYGRRRAEPNAVAWCDSPGGGSPRSLSHDRAHVGAKVLVGFTPGLFTAFDRRGMPPPGTHTFRPDAVLVHELVHAAEMMRGCFRSELAGSTARDIAPVGEHRAVRVANMYHAEVGYPLRGAYDDIAPMRSGLAVFAEHGWAGYRDSRVGASYRTANPSPPNMSNSRHVEILDFERRLMERFIMDHPALCGELERIPRPLVWYNPVQDFRTKTFPYVLVPAPWQPRPSADGPAGWIQRLG